MRIIVTGAAGFIGSHLSERLVGYGHEVIAIDALTNFYSVELKRLNVKELKNIGLEVKELNLVNDNLSQLVQNVDFVFHLAAQPGISSATPFIDYEQNNIYATYRLVEILAQSNRMSGFVNVATSSIYGADATSDETTETKPTSFYGVTKLAAEQLVMSYMRDKGFPATSLRLFSVYGPRERPEKLYPKLIHSILTGKPFPLYEGSQEHLRSYTYVDDIVDGLIATMDNFEVCNGEIFNIGTDNAITTGEGISIVEEILGKKAIIESKPKRSGDQLRTHANIEKAKRLIGYNPKVTPRIGLEKEVFWYKTKVFGCIDPYVNL